MHRFRFGIRLIALAVLVIAVFLGNWKRNASQRRILVESIVEKGGGIYWSDQPTRRWIPSFLADRLPKEFCFDPLNVDTVNITDDELAQIGRLFGRLEALGIKDADLKQDGLRHLAQLEDLSQLRIYDKECPDLTQLSSCQQLVKLDVDSPRFENQDLKALEGCDSLQLVMLFQADITPEGLKVVSDKLPNCDFSVFPNSNEDTEQFATVQYDKSSKTVLTFEDPPPGPSGVFEMPGNAAGR